MRIVFFIQLATLRAELVLHFSYRKASEVYVYNFCTRRKLQSNAKKQSILYNARDPCAAIFTETK